MVSFKNLVVAAVALVGFAQAAPTTHIAQTDTIVKDGYIIKLRSGTSDFDSHVSWVKGVHKRNLAKRGAIEQVFKGIERMYTGEFHWNGYAGQFDADTIKEIRNHPDVSQPLIYGFTVVLTLARSSTSKRTASGKSPMYWATRASSKTGISPPRTMPHGASAASPIASPALPATSTTLTPARALLPT